MRLSQYFVPTLKEIPAEAQIPSHQLMVRAGLIRPLGAGIYSMLPLGWRVHQKVSEIIRQEMNNIGGQEFHLPALSPAEIWEATGRVEDYGDTMFHIKNRAGLVLAPTHEEVFTSIAKQSIQSYKDLPQIWYQIQTKFRNEARPRSGVLRGREFTMKDAYSFDATWEALDKSYSDQEKAYRNIFTRSGLKFFSVSAHSGAMGGSASEEFMIASEFGEDTVVYNEESGYAANIEVAKTTIPGVSRIAESNMPKEFSTPGARTIDDLVGTYSIDEMRCAKSVVYICDGKPWLVLMTGNDELSETKLQTALSASQLRPAEETELESLTGAKAGSIGPLNLKKPLELIADERLRDANGLVSGANKNDVHVRNIDLVRDVKGLRYADLRVVREGEPDSIAGKPIKISKAIEIGHIFKLGTKYSEALGAMFLDENGKTKPLIMGSYGIGVERIMACHIEQHHDERGITWGKELAPFDVALLAVNIKKKEIVDACEKLLLELEASGLEVLYDDRRDASAGIKFNDADLVGLPLQIIVGEKNLVEGNVEIKIRTTSEREVVPVSEAVARAKKFFTK